MAGGTFPLELERPEYARVAAGDRIENLQVEWPTPDGVRSLVASGGIVVPPGRPPVAVLTFEDVTELASGRRADALARDELEAILAGVADAVTVQDARGRLVYVNDAAVRLLGEQIGRPDRAALLAAAPDELAAGFEMLDEDGRPLALDQLPGRRALMGEEPEPLIVCYVIRATGERRWSRVKARPMRSPGGTVTRAINVIEDITDLKQAELTQRLLAEAGRVLAGSLDYEETLRRVAWLAVPDLADWCMVDIFTDRGLERVAVACADPARSEHAHRMQGILIDPTADDRAGGRRPHRPRRAVPGGRRGPSAPHRAQPGAPRGDPRARRALGVQRAADAARRAPRRDDAVHDRLGPPARPR